jgi:hypothetical protein
LSPPFVSAESSNSIAGVETGVVVELEAGPVVGVLSSGRGSLGALVVVESMTVEEVVDVDSLCGGVRAATLSGITDSSSG